MGTIKKSDFKKAVKEGKSLDEFVDDEGGIISGDERYNMNVDVKTGPINQPDDEKGISTTTDDHRATSIQPRNWWWSLSYGYGQSSSTPTDIHDIGESIDESELTEEQMMKKMVEDILSKKSSNTDIVRRMSDNDVSRAGIPDIDKIEDTKMIVVGKIKDLIDSLGNENLNGEELGIVLNYFLKNINTEEIPSDYKNIIRKAI